MASASTVLTLLGFGVSVVFIVFVCSRLACALARRRRRARLRLAPDALPHFAAAVADASYYSFPAVHQAQGRTGSGGGGGTGLDPAAVAAFPTGAFSAAGPRRGSGAASESSDAAGPQCIVCLAEYEEKDMLRFLPFCGHNFHMACIDLWLKQNSTCPVCRISLRDDPDSKQTAPPPPPSVVISPPCSPRVSRSDPCNCLFVGAGHSSRASEVLRQEPDLENQMASGPSVVTAASNLPLSEVNPAPENNSQTASKQVER